MKEREPRRGTSSLGRGCLGQPGASLPLAGCVTPAAHDLSEPGRPHPGQGEKQVGVLWAGAL